MGRRVLVPPPTLLNWKPIRASTSAVQVASLKLKSVSSTGIGVEVMGNIYGAIGCGELRYHLTSRLSGGPRRGSRGRRKACQTPAQRGGAFAGQSMIYR